jgi:hypothetical protein
MVPMQQNIIYALLACFLFAGCAANTSKIMPGYENITTNSATLGVILVPGHIKIDNPADVLDDLGKGTAIQSYITFFNTEFIAALEKYSNFSKISIRSMPEQNECKDTLLNLNTIESLHSAVPVKAGCCGDSDRYILIIDNLSIFRKVIQGQAMVGVGSDNLVHKGTFVMYDNVKGQIVSFGTLYETAPIIFNSTRETWSTVLKNLAHAITVKQPYRYQQPK